ncbi:MAG: haloacid dehalogenase [Magnetovibrio sp.]|nr:haloacid dehalogenase [Magnetovibrio sp.]
MFDCDGTLVDSQYSITNCIYKAFEDFQLPKPSHEEVKQVIGLPLNEVISALVADLDFHNVEGLCHSYSNAWQHLRKKNMLDEPLFPGVEETLKILRKENWLLGIATGKSRRGLVGTLNKHGVLHHFVTVQTADKRPGKPHPDMLLKAIEETRVIKDNTVMIGDTTFDIEMATNAGVKAIGVSWGYHTVDALRSAGAKDVITTFDQLTSILMP